MPTWGEIRTLEKGPWGARRLAVVDAAELVSKELESRYADEFKAGGRDWAFKRAVRRAALGSSITLRVNAAWELRREVVHEFRIPTPEQARTAVDAFEECHRALLERVSHPPTLYSSVRYAEEVTDATRVIPELDRQEADQRRAEVRDAKETARSADEKAAKSRSELETHRAWFNAEALRATKWVNATIWAAISLGVVMSILTAAIHHYRIFDVRWLQVRSPVVRPEPDAGLMDGHDAR